MTSIGTHDASRDAFDASECNYFKVSAFTSLALLQVTLLILGPCSLDPVALHYCRAMTESGRHGQAIDRSYRFAERISPLTRAADQPCGLQGVFRLATWNAYLEVGFSLRCFQRLSVPYMATGLCSWQNNPHTRGTSIQVLSYYG